jgi:predicted transcriptional regulator
MDALDVTKKQLLWILHTHILGFNREDLQDRLAISRTTIGIALKQLTSEGKVLRSASGRYIENRWMNQDAIQDKQ